jgi:acyl carrier protein
LSSSYDSIESKIRDLLVSYLESSGSEELQNHGEITGTTNLVSDLTMDSFQVMEYLMEIEDSYDIAIDMNSLSNAHTVQDLAEIVTSLVQE